MGNNPSTTTVEDDLTWRKSLVQLRKDHFGTLLMNPQSQLCYLLRQYTYSSQQQFTKELTRLQRQAQTEPHQNILAVVRASGQQISQFCSTNYKLYAAYEFTQVTLQNQIEARLKSLKYFDQTELWSILQSCVSALNKTKLSINFLPDKVFIVPNGQLKLIHGDLIDQNSRVMLLQNCYYAPEKLTNFNRADSQSSLLKQLIFSLGITILHTGQLKPAFGCYDYENKLFLDNELQMMMQLLAERYSTQFMQVLVNMLQPNPNRRASLMQVQDMLTKHWSQQGHEEEEEPEEEVKHNQRHCLSNEKIKSGIMQGKLISTEQNTHQDILNASNVNVNVNVYNSANAYIDTNVTNQHKIITSGQPSYSFPTNYPSSYPLSTHQPFEVKPYPNLNRYPQSHPNDKQNLFTDPKLLQMIRKDLDSINKLKQSSYYQSTKYQPLYQQTQSLVSSVKRNYALYPNPLNSHNHSQLQSPQTINPNPNQKPLASQPSSPIFIYQDGRKYIGTLFQGKKQGYGKLIYEDGAYYEGDFKNDLMHGYGILYYKSQQPAYKGHWMQDHFHGSGVLYNQNPMFLDGQFDYTDFNQIEDYWVCYDGHFDYDNKSGQGKLVLSNGQMLEGQFLQDCINGQAKFTTINGDKICGYWEGNVLVQGEHDWK